MVSFLHSNILGISFLNSKVLASSTEDIYGKDLPPEDEPNRSNKSDTVSLLATGSSDPFVYVYSLGQFEVNQPTKSQGTSELIQRLEGHTDRVYSVDFHPKEPVLASCSADFTVRVWSSNLRKRKS